MSSALNGSTALLVSSPDPAGGARDNSAVNARNTQRVTAIHVAVTSSIEYSLAECVALWGEPEQAVT